MVSHGVLFGAEWPAVDEASLAACYREALANDPTITGWVLVDGSHAGVSVKDSRGVPRSLANCAATTFLPASLVEGHGRVYVRFR